MPEDYEKRLDGRNRPPGVSDRAVWEIALFEGAYLRLIYLDEDRNRVQSMMGRWGQRGLPEDMTQDELPDGGRRSGS